MNEVLIVIIAIIVVIGGAALAYFLVKKFLANDEPAKPKKPKAEKAAAPKETAEEKQAKAKAVSEEKARAAAEKRRAEMMKKIEVKADPKVLEHRVVKKAKEEICKNVRAIERIEVKANRIDWIVKEEYTDYSSGNVFFDDLALHRLEQGEMKLVAEHLYDAVKNTGFEIEEEGSGEKGTFRYHIDKYIIKAL